MRKYLICLWFFLIALLCGCKNINKVESTPTEGLVFTAENGTYVVSSYSGEEIDIIIPDKYNDIPVTVIGEDCFADTDIRSVRIGENIMEIRAGAFYNASMLKEINIPASVKVIGIDDSDASLTNTNKYGAFRNCISLEKVVFDENSTFKILGYSTFEDCAKLKEIVLPETTTYIGTSAFSNCTSIMNIDIPVNVTYMGMNVFFGFTAEQTINVMGNTNEWLYTTVYEHYGVTIDKTWINNCNAVVNYHRSSGNSMEGNKIEEAPDANQMQAYIMDLLNKSRNFCYGIVTDDGHGKSYYYLDSDDNEFNVVDITLNEDGISAKVNCCYKSDGTNYYGYYMVYYDPAGWYFTDEDLNPLCMVLTDNDFDYSTGAVGEFYTEFGDEYTYFVIHKIENNELIYSLESNDSIIINFGVAQGNNLTAEFDSKTMSAKLESTDGDYVEFRYHIEADSWGFGAVEVERWSK